MGATRYCRDKNGLFAAGPRRKKHVNEVFQDDQDRVAELFRAGGKIYLCGSASRLGRSTAEACKSVYRAKSGKSAKEAEEWLDQVKVDRYVSDVY